MFVLGFFGTGQCFVSHPPLRAMPSFILPGGSQPELTCKFQQQERTQWPNCTSIDTRNQRITLQPPLPYEGQAVRQLKFAMADQRHSRLS